MIYVPPLTPHCKLETAGRNYFSWWAGACLWLKKRPNTVYHLPDDSPPQGKLTTRPHRLARAGGSRCPFTLINLPVFRLQLYQSDPREDTRCWSVSAGLERKYKHALRMRGFGSSWDWPKEVQSEGNRRPFSVLFSQSILFRWFISPPFTQRFQNAQICSFFKSCAKKLPF